MFRQSKDEHTAQEFANSNNIIGKGSIFTGNIETYGNLRIEGKIIGDVKSKSKIAIGPSAMIEGNVIAQIAEIEGEIKGSVEATDVLTLKPTCLIAGDIIANKLVVEAGAKFEGKCKMGHAARKIEMSENAMNKKEKILHKMAKSVNE